MELFHLPAIDTLTSECWLQAGEGESVLCMNPGELKTPLKILGLKIGIHFWDSVSIINGERLVWLCGAICLWSFFQNSCGWEKDSFGCIAMLILHLPTEPTQDMYNIRDRVHTWMYRVSNWLKTDVKTKDFCTKRTSLLFRMLYALPKPKPGSNSIVISSISIVEWYAKRKMPKEDFAVALAVFLHQELLTRENS